MNKYTNFICFPFCVISQLFCFFNFSILGDFHKFLILVSHFCRTFSRNFRALCLVSAKPCSVWLKKNSVIWASIFTWILSVVPMICNLKKYISGPKNRTDEFFLHFLLCYFFIISGYNAAVWCCKKANKMNKPNGLYKKIVFATIFLRECCNWLVNLICFPMLQDKCDKQVKLTLKYIIRWM